MSRVRLSDETSDGDESLAAELSDILSNWKDMVEWEETPFRSSDDVVLLSYKFHYSHSGGGMERVTESGATWYVDISKTVPVWYLNGKKIGTLSYDKVVGIFSKEK